MSVFETAGSVKVLTTKPFTFCLGPHLEECYVHLHAFDKISEPLNKLMNGTLSEAQSGRAELPTVNPEAFAALVEYAYTKSVTGSLWRYTHSLEDDEADPKDSQWLEWDILRNSSYAKFLELAKTFVVTNPSAEEIRENVAASQLKHKHKWGPPAEELIHWIKIATLANKYLIRDLEMAMLYGLHTELHLTGINDENKHHTIDRVVAVMEYIYDTEEDVHDSAIEIIFQFYVGYVETFSYITDLEDMYSRDASLTARLITILTRCVTLRAK